MPAHKKQGAVQWTSNLAYVVGLLTTDGNLSKDERHIDFTSKDVALINTLKRCLGLHNKIGKKHGGFTRKTVVYRIQFGNVIFYRWLQKVGLMPNKTKKVAELKIPKEYFFDFLRGHLDGDGTIRRYYDPIFPKSLRIYVTFLSASYRHIVWIRNEIRNILSITGFIRQPPRVYSLTFSKHDSLLLLSKLYHHPDVPRLERKFKLVKDLLVR